MATTASPEPPVGICVDVFRDAISKRVLYVEAGKDLVDLLLTFLTLPVGAALRALQQAPQEPMAPAAAAATRTGAIFNVYDSVKQLEQSSMCVDKEVLLEQKAVCPAAAASLALLGIDMAPAPTIASSAAEPSAGLDPSFDLCMEWFPEFQDLEEGDEADEVHTSSTNMFHEEDDDKPTTEVVKNGGDLTSDNEVKSGGDGFVKTRLRYMVHDDLTIRPASAMNSFALLRKLQVKTIADVECFKTTVGSKEALLLLQASLASKTALNDVFGAKPSCASVWELNSAPHSTSTAQPYYGEG